MPRTPTLIVERAKALMAEGKPEEARNLLLNAASGPTAEPDARPLYEELFPLSERQREWVAGTLSQLASKDAGVRVKAAKELCRKAAAESSVEQRDLIGDPRISDYLIRALSSGESKVAECATIAVSQAALFYYRDWRAWEPILEKLESKSPVTRRWAVEASGYLGGERALNAILPLQEDRDEDVRNQACRSLTWMLRSNVLTSGGKRRLLEEFLSRLESKKAPVRSFAANALRLVNDRAAIEPLRKALKRETGKEPKQWINHAIRCLEAGDPELPV